MKIFPTEHDIENTRGELRELLQALQAPRKIDELPVEHLPILEPNEIKPIEIDLNEINEQILIELRALHATLHELLKHITNL